MSYVNHAFCAPPKQIQFWNNPIRFSFGKDNDIVIDSITIIHESATIQLGKYVLMRWYTRNDCDFTCIIWTFELWTKQFSRKRQPNRKVQVTRSDMNFSFLFPFYSHLRGTNISSKVSDFHFLATSFHCLCISESERRVFLVKGSALTGLFINSFWSHFVFNKHIFDYYFISTFRIPHRTHTFVFIFIPFLVFLSSACYHRTCTHTRMN